MGALDDHVKLTFEYDYALCNIYWPDACRAKLERESGVTKKKLSWIFRDQAGY